MPHTKSPFDVKLSEEAERELTTRLVQEIRGAKSARDAMMNDGGLIDFAYSLYEQQAQKGISRDTHRYGGADLTSPIGTENVDALSARAIHTIFKLEPLWIVEGIGASAEKAPVVEEWMQWRQEQMRLQKVAKRVITSALVETGAICEACEDAERVVRHETVKAQLQRADDGGMLLDAKTGKPMALLNPETGEPVPAESGSDEFVEVHRTWTDYRRRGAYVRRRSMKDFVFLPSHAEDEREVWGHANRVWLTMGELLRREQDGEFQNVDKLGGDTQERETRAEHERSSTGVDTPYGFDLSEKELWRVQFWADLGKGQCFYTALVSERHDAIVSLKYDWLQRFRTVYVNPYPCPYSVYGYSMVLIKLLTTIEEHTARRNMNADRGTLKSNAPLKRLHGAQWDPSIQPFGAGEVIDVGNMNEIQPFEFEDVTPQGVEAERACVTDAQRIIGMNDIAIGQVSTKSRTLGENEMATQGSFVRTDDPIGNIQESLEELGEILHAIEVQTLRDMEQGQQAPASMTEKIQLSGDTSFDGTFTADMVSGDFRFKPRASSDTADPNRRQQIFVNGLGVLSNWAKISPQIAQRMQTPQFGDALMQMWVTEFKPRDKQAFLAPLPPPPQMLPPGGQPGPGGEGEMPPSPQFGQQVLAELVGQLPQGTVQ